MMDITVSGSQEAIEKATSRIELLVADASSASSASFRYASTASLV